MRDHPLYRHRGKLALLLLALLALALLLPSGTEHEAPTPEERPAPEIMPTPSPGAGDATESGGDPRSGGDGEATGDRPAALRQAIADLELALTAAVEERKRAEAALEQSEQDVVELERFIEEIEERGEDPADYADEGLEKFRPAYIAFEEASSRLEQAEESEAAIRAELAAAEERLAGMQ